MRKGLFYSLFFNSCFIKKKNDPYGIRFHAYILSWFLVTVCTGYYLQTTSRSQLGRVKRDCEVAQAILKVLKEHIPGKVEGDTLFFVTLQKFPADVGNPFVTKGCSFREALRNKESGAFVIGKFCWLACARGFLVSVLIFTVVYHTILCIMHTQQVAWN